MGEHLSISHPRPLTMSAPTRHVPALLTGVLLLASILACSGERRQRRGEPSEPGQLTHDGSTRTYTLYLPDSLPPDAALVVALHGGGGDAAKAQSAYGFNPLASQHGFAVLYPEGIDSGWNDGRAGTKQLAQVQDIDDVGFLSALIASTLKAHELDPDRVYITGASNGAMMSARMLCERPELFAAAAPVIGGLPRPLQMSCAGARPTPLLIIKGDADPLVPMQGGAVGGAAETRSGAPRGEVTSTEDELEHWRAINGCEAQVSATATFDADAQDAQHTVLQSWSTGCERAPIHLYTVHGGGHTWPGLGTQYAPKRIVGLPSKDIIAQDVIWAFFASFP